MPTSHTRKETAQFSLPSVRFETVHTDIIGPLPPTTTYNGVYTSPARYVSIFANPSARVGYDTRSTFKRSLIGLNSELSFS